jgi:hypothetical protein
MGHIILAGDSIFDNKAYVNGPDVVTQLQTKLPAGWKTTLKAIDGSVIYGIKRQLEDIPTDSSHIIVSVGGNNALQQLSLFEQPVKVVAEALHGLAYDMEAFEKEYFNMLKEVLDHKLPTTICTIYYPRFDETQLQRLAVTALSVFNDCIIRAAYKSGIPLIDLRLVCDDYNDYANPIEPSEQGGNKISDAIIKAVFEHDYSSRRTSIYF